MNNADSSYDHTKYNRRLMGNIVRLPMIVAGAFGAEIYDQEHEKELLDFWGDEGVASLGYGDTFNDYVREFLDSGIPHRLPDVYPHELRFRAAEMICSRTGMDRLFFSNSGTEANEAAIKLARKYWWDKEREGRFDDVLDLSTTVTARRHQVYTINGNFHGRTGYSLAASDFRVSPYHRIGFGPTARGFGVLTDDLKVAAFDGLDWEGPEQGPAHLDPSWDRVAAVMLAPVLGNNLVKTYSPDFWENLARARREHGFLLIYDDVQAGNGRAGYFATWQKYGVKPDIMTLSKGIAMGLPMSVTLASEEVAKAFTVGVHFNTFGGTLLCCHLAIKLYEWLDKNLPTVREKGDYIREQFGKRTWIKHFDGSGMLNAFQPDFDKFGYTGFDFIARARELGLALVTHREKGMIRFTPPLNVDGKILDKAFDILDETQESLSMLKGL